MQAHPEVRVHVGFEGGHRSLLSTLHTVAFLVSRELQRSWSSGGIARASAWEPHREPECAPHCLSPTPSPQALLKLDCQGLVVRLIQDFVLLTTAVEVAQRWRELAEKLAKVSKQQMDAYESPHRDKNGVVDSEVSGALARGPEGAAIACLRGHRGLWPRGDRSRPWGCPLSVLLGHWQGPCTGQ